MNNRKIAIEAVKKGGKIISDNFKGHYDIKRKAKHDFATDIDLKAEEKIIETLERSGFTIFGEETGEHARNQEKKWIVDPLDGTTNFILGVPLFSSAIALTEQNEILVSAIYLPMTDDLIVAEKGEGAEINGQKIKVSEEEKIEDSFLIFCHGKRPKDSERAVKLYQTFKTKCKDLRQLGSASIEFATVGAGRAEAFINPGIPSYDAAPGILVVKEAGGKITDFEGEEWDFSKQNLIASNGRIHEKVIQMLGN